MADYDKSKLNKFLGKVTQDPKDLYAAARKAGYTHAEIVDAHPSYADKKQRGVGRDSLNSEAQVEGRKAMGAQLAAQIRGGGGSGGGGSDTRDLQLGADLDPKSMMKKEGYKKGGKVKKYASGGIPAAVKPEPKKDTMPEWAKNERANRKQDELNKREAEGATKEVKRNMSTFGFKRGGSVSSASSRADGIAQRGKTRGKIC